MSADASLVEATSHGRVSSYGPPRVDVCICTFHRPSLQDTLLSLFRMAPGNDTTFRIIVCDNDAVPSAKPLFERAAAETTIDCLYIHAPANNIAIARNACLAAATAEFVAFIDDDEQASTTWLSHLLRAIEDTDADIVFGPVNANYPPETPSWLVEGDFLSARPMPTRSGELETGYSGNVLMRRSICAKHRFNTTLGKSGGEDTEFFAGLHRAGARLAYCSDALVTEPAAEARLRFGWHLKRWFRNGQTYCRVLLEQRAQRTALAVSFAGKVFCFGVMAIVNLYAPVRWRRYTLRAVYNVGCLSALFGVAPIDLY